MMGKAFLNAVANGKVDILQVFLEILVETGAHYCVVGGLAVNAYAEPVVSLDLDIVVISGNIDKVCKVAEAKGLKIARFENSINLTSPKSDLRIQLQTDARYQPFIDRARQKDVLGYRMNVASLEDVLQGKIWAYSDEQRRKSKKQKDLADIMRLVEVYPDLETRLPPSIRNLLTG
jgi:Nucleotidyl transferase AbiEii toxin, Type IV TA system